MTVARPVVPAYYPDDRICAFAPTGGVQEAFQVLYQSGGCIEAFHKHRGTRSLVISPWHAGTRQVDYELSIKAPAFVTNIVGKTPCALSPILLYSCFRYGRKS